MKQCPQCSNTYTDNSLNYCLQDGTLLITPHSDSQADTLILPTPENQKGTYDDTIYKELVEILKGIEIKTSIKNLTDSEDEVKQLEAQLKTLNITDEEELTVDLLSTLKTYSDVLIIGIYNRVNIPSMERFLFFGVCPKLEIYGLATNEGVPNAAYRRYALSPKGIGLLEYMERHNL